MRVLGGGERKKGIGSKRKKCGLLIDEGSECHCWVQNNVIPFLLLDSFGEFRKKQVSVSKSISSLTIASGICN